MLIYHEKQEAALCGVHCLNTLLQGHYFTELDLAQVVQRVLGGGGCTDCMPARPPPPLPATPPAPCQPACPSLTAASAGRCRSPRSWMPWNVPY
jgi:hypothetical protein